MVKSQKVLIVDDSPLLRTYIKRVLGRRYENELVEISTAGEFYSYLTNTPVEEVGLVLLDIIMPDGNGLEILQNLKNNKTYKDLPVIMISSNLNKENALFALKASAKDLIVKPFNEDDLLERVDRILITKPQEKQVCVVSQNSIHDFYKQIHIELKRSARSKTPVSFLLASIIRAQTLDSPLRGYDCAQIVSFGDTYRLLFEGSLRETDIIISLSAIEYLLILPCSDDRGAAYVSEKAKRVFKDLSCSEGMTNLTLIVSTVTFPEHGDNPDDIILTLENNFKKQYTIKTLDIIQEEQHNNF